MTPIKPRDQDDIARRLRASPSIIDSSEQTHSRLEVISEGDWQANHSAYLHSQLKLVGVSNNGRSLTFRPSLVDSKGVSLQPKVGGIGSRTQALGITWRPLTDRKGSTERDAALTKGSNKKLQMKFSGELDILNSYWGWKGTIDPEYELLEPYTLLDTETYYLQALRRMHSLMFRNGFNFNGKKHSLVAYIEKRFDQIAFVSRQTTDSLFKDILWHLLVCSNCIVSKVRDANTSGGSPNEKNDKKTPVAAYCIIPPHTIVPYLDGYGGIEKWRRFFKDGRPFRDYLPEDIIHFKWDVKPGHIYGTPGHQAVRDDIFALRRLEENVELLLIHHLFPLFHVKIGDKDFPCEYFPDGSSEIDVVRSAIMNMSKEGVFVTDHRVTIDVHGANGQGLDPTPILEHFRKRIIIGMGVSGIDLGDSDTANASTADNVSQNLKDLMKWRLANFNGQIEMNMVRELFEEAPFKLSVQNAVSDVKLTFGEIDTDGMIKAENHATDLYNNSGITNEEFRARLRKQPLTKEQEADTHYQRATVGIEKVRSSLRIKEMDKAHEQNLEATAQSGAGPTKKTTTSKSKSASGGVTHKKVVEEPAKTAAQKTVATKNRPENQHGKNLDPHKAKSSEDPNLAQAIYDRLVEVRRELRDSDKLTAETMSAMSYRVIDSFELGESDPVLDDRLRTAVGLTMDEDMLWAVLTAVFEMAADDSLPEAA